MMRVWNQHSKLRSVLLVLLALVVFLYYVFHLIQIQVVDAQVYRNMVQGITRSTQHVKAIRGEIVDRNGVPLVQNEISYNVVFDLAFLPNGKTNETIAKVVSIFEQNDTEWIDNLPISYQEPFSFLSHKPEDVATLRQLKKAQEYATAEQIMHWLVEEYKLQEYTPTEARKIAGVRYEMERRDFSLQHPYIFAKHVNEALMVQIKEHSFELMGVMIDTSAVRVYPDDTIAPHILGLVGPLYQEDYEALKKEGLIFDPKSKEYDSTGYLLNDEIGKSGIEKAFEAELRGKNGVREVQMDSQGNVVQVVEQVVPTPGNTVVLTIDSTMQKNLQDYLEAQTKYLAEHEPPGRGGDAHSAAGVVLNVKTGEVLAAATYPSYSIDDYVNRYEEVLRRKGRPLINRAIMGEYTPGSIYKPVVALTGLNKGTITENSTFFCGHVYTFFAPTYTPQCLGSHGNINVINALGWSCNIYFYETGRIAGIDAMDDMAKALGLGEPTGIEIEEGLGQRSNPQVKETRGGGEWYGADTIQTAIGQFDNKFTPLQLANYAATIANHGKRMKVTILRDIHGFSAEPTGTFTPQVAYDMAAVSPEAFDVTIKGMVNATTGSAGGTFGGYPISVASKTGTPQVTEDVVNSTFIAFAPVEDPEIAVCIVIEEGWQGYTGAPVAKAIFDDYFGVEHVSAVQSGPQILRQQRKEEAEKKQQENKTTTEEAENSVILGNSDSSSNI